MAAGRRSSIRPRAPAPAPISAFTKSPSARDHTARILTHGTTLHGIQNLLPGLETRADLLLCPPLGRRPHPHQCRRPVRRPSADRRGRARQRHPVLLRPAEPGLDLLRDRPGDGPGRAQPLLLPLALRAAGPDRARRRPDQPVAPAAPIRSTSSPSTPSPRTRCRCTCSPARRCASTAARCSADGIVLVPHLQPLSRPEAGDRRPRRARGLDRRDAAICARRARGGAERHHLGLDRPVAQPGDDRAADRAVAATIRSIGSRSRRSRASPAGATTTPRSCRSSTSARCCRDDDRDRAADPQRTGARRISSPSSATPTRRR